MALTTPRKGRPDPLGKILGLAFGGGDTIVDERSGYLTIPHWNPEMDGWLIGDSYDFNAWRQLDVLKVPPMGVCDSIDQFDAKYGEALRADELLDWCVFFTHVAKDPSNAGKGGGWRWHKWGQYVGEGEPKQEYLDDEDGFDDGVYTFHVYRTRP